MSTWSTGWPPINAFIDMLYGTAGVDYGALCCFAFGSLDGTVWNGNPPYTVTDFVGVYPKFVGPATNLTNVVVTANSASVSGISPNIWPTFIVGQLVIDPNFPKDTLVLATPSTGVITLSNSAMTNATSIQSIYTAPWMPIVAILMYVNLASASVMIARYQEAWPICMAWFIAHYCTLFMRTESGSNNTAAQVAASGLTKGIVISRHAGDVGASSQLLLSAGYDQWGAWNETQYGEQFITMARAVNAGPIYTQ